MVKSFSNMCTVLLLTGLFVLPSCGSDPPNENGNRPTADENKDSSPSDVEGPFSDINEDELTEVVCITYAELEDYRPGSVEAIDLLLNTSAEILNQVLTPQELSYAAIAPWGTASAEDIVDDPIFIKIVQAFAEQSYRGRFVENQIDCAIGPSVNMFIRRSGSGGIMSRAKGFVREVIQTAAVIGPTAWLCNTAMTNIYSALGCVAVGAWMLADYLGSANASELEPGDYMDPESWGEAQHIDICSAVDEGDYRLSDCDEDGFSQVDACISGTWITIGREYPCEDDGDDICDEDEADCEFNPVVKDISSGGWHNCALKMDGQIQCWGLDHDGQTRAPSGTFLQVSAGTGFSCALTMDGQIQCWGSNDFNEASPPSGTFVQLSAGSLHACAVRESGEIQCWGDNQSGEASAPAGTFVQVSAGSSHTCALRTDGQVQCWGINQSGQASAPAGTFVQVSAAMNHSCGLDIEGHIQCWGSNERSDDTPPEGTFVQISAGDAHSCALDTEGQIQCWGWDKFDRASPPDGRFLKISTGRTHNCAINTAGRVQCWGQNQAGESTVPEGL